MPHAISTPGTGFQAVILCGPGVSLDTFTSNPAESPKALIPVANRPMIWYPLNFCYRMGVTDVTLITPPSSEPAITKALRTHPLLTALPSPKANIIAPKELNETTGTAQIFRFPEVRAIIKGDFIVLPCDIICELSGESLIASWFIREASLGGTMTHGKASGSTEVAISGVKPAHSGGLGVWYSTKGGVKGEETNFIATSPMEVDVVPPQTGSLNSDISNLVYSVSTDTLNDITEEQKSIPLRHGLLRQHPRFRMLSSHRDAHIYVLPFWIMEFIQENEKLDSFSEDVIGWWAKAGWQNGLAKKLGLENIFNRSKHAPADDVNGVVDEDSQTDPNLAGLVTTSSGFGRSQEHREHLSEGGIPQNAMPPVGIPPVLAYIHPTSESAPIIRRVDTSAILLNTSLLLAKLDAIDQGGREDLSPFAPLSKVASSANIATRSTVTKPDCLIADNVTIEEKVAIKECVIGANCLIKEGAKLTRCVLMDGIVVGSGCKLTACVLGRRADIGPNSTLQDCEVEDNMRIEAETESKGEKFKSSEGLEAREEDMKDAFDSDGDNAIATPTERHG